MPPPGRRCETVSRRAGEAKYAAGELSRVAHTDAPMRRCRAWASFFCVGTDKRDMMEEMLNGDEEAEKTMCRERAASLTERAATRDAGCAWNVLRGVLLTWLALSVTACVAQQADLVKMQEAFDAKMDDMVNVRAQIRSELRNLREENLPRLRGALDTEAHQLNQKVEVLAKEVVALTDRLEDRLERQGEESATRIATLGKNIDEALDRQSQSVHGRFAEFQDSLGQFKTAMEDLEQADERLAQELDQERNRATNTETGMRQALDAQQEQQQAFLQKNTEALRNYLADEVKKTIEDITMALHKSNRTLSDAIETQGIAIEAQAARLFKVGASLKDELAALRQTDVHYGNSMEEATRSLAQLRDALKTMGERIGAKLDRQSEDEVHTTERVNQIRSRSAALAAKLDADTKALRGYLEKEVQPTLASMAASMSKNFEHLKDLAQHVQALNQAAVNMRKALDSVAGKVDEHESRLMKLQKALKQPGQPSGSP